METDPTDRPPAVDYVVTAEDVTALRELAPRRIRFPFIEYALHVAAAIVALVVAAILLFARRTDLMPVSLGVVAGIWLVAWIYFARFLFGRSPESAVWFERLRQSPVLSTGLCRAELRDDGLHIDTPLATHHFMPEQLEDGLYEDDHFFIRTTAGHAIIIPRRAFDSDNAWTSFIAAVTTTAQW